MRYLSGIASYAAWRLNQSGLSKVVLKWGLTGEIGQDEHALSIYLRRSKHFYLLGQLEELNLKAPYKNYLAAVILKHERSYKAAWRKIQSMDHPGIVPFKVRLLYDMKHLKELVKLINDGVDVLSSLNTDQKYNLLRYLLSANYYSEAELMVRSTADQMPELMEFLEEEKNDTYTKYTWTSYKEGVLHLQENLSPENFTAILSEIDRQQEQLQEMGYILLVNTFYGKSGISELLNEKVIQYFEERPNLIQYVDLEALHTLNFNLDKYNNKSMELQKLLNYYDMGQQSQTIVNSIIKLLPEVNVTRQYIMHLRMMIGDGTLRLDNENFINLIKRDRRIHAVFNTPKLFLDDAVQQEVDDFLVNHLSQRDRIRIYRLVVDQLIHSRAEMQLPPHFVQYIESSAPPRIRHAYILVRYYFREGKHDRIEKTVAGFKPDKQLKLRLYLIKYLYYQGYFAEALDHTFRAGVIKPNHPDVIRNFIRNYHRVGNITKRYEYVRKMHALYPAKLYHNEYDMSVQEYQLFKDKWSMDPDEEQRIEQLTYVPTPKKILFVLNKALPAINGYTVRSHEMIKRVKEEGYTPVVATRLGWSPNQEGYTIPKTSDYTRYYIDKGEFYPSNKTPLKDYFNKYTEELLDIIEKERPSIIHAASNFQNALPALHIGRSLNLKTVYEVRGLWHYTQSTKNSDFYESERFMFQEDYEIECCKIASEVICISESLKKHLMQNGVPEKKIKVIPNGVDSHALLPTPKNEEILDQLGLHNKHVLGFVGSLTSYEGIELVFEAMKVLKNSPNIDKDLVFLIVGEGPYKDDLLDRVKALDLERSVIFTGRVPRGEVSKYYSVIDIAPFPRVDAPVCHLVTPIKTYEAMAMEKKVLVSDVNALAEMVVEGVNGMFFKADDVGELASSIESILQRDRIGERARRWVVENREWKVLIKRLIPIYEEQVTH
ncbi:glycosyltransferase family 4 protein [Salinicoccus roseus]|nr:glycosyltransferase family 4 protein [Salinicoccus roseus]RPE54809.1 glycosyltransferase involved in cell wall biosynthesis [Salinicoccus roseus]GGA62484.1 hypothetical protein GCM10007176_03620 [Salinicoccus roseus]